MSSKSLILNTLSDKRVVEQINSGAIGVIPTDTVYGLVCLAADMSAVERLYALKDRHAKPGTIIAASIDQLVGLGFKSRYLKPVSAYWPGAISVVIPTHELQHLHQGVGSVAVRIPDDQALLALLQQTGPLLTSSANQPGQPESINLDQARAYFGDSLNYYVDGGDLTGRLPSTVIRIVDDAIEILRPGAVKIKETGEIEQ